MIARLRATLLLGAACLAAVVCSELIYRSALCRDWIGRGLGRADLLAIADGKGFYESDLGDVTGKDLAQLIIAENLRRLSAAESSIAAGAVERELELIRAQFGDEKRFEKARRISRISRGSLRTAAHDHLRARKWLEEQIAARPEVAEEECRQLYEAKKASFTQPVRLRARHLFLAAPAHTPAEVIEEKRKAIESLAIEISAAGSFSERAAAFSEDEATKSRGGDLGFFSSWRMEAEFFAEAQKLPAGKTSPPFQTALGFHIVEVMEIKPPREMPFEEVRAEIALALANEKRRAAGARLTESLLQTQYLRAALRD